MKKLFFALLLATSAIICVAPSQQLSARESYKGVYGSFYTTETGTSIAAGDAVPFELTAVNTLGVMISDGNILIRDRGDYLVTYGVALNTGAEFQMFLNGEFIPGTQQHQGPDLYHPFTTIIRVSEPSSILSIVAVTAASLKNSVAGDTTAFLTILKVN